MVRRTTPAPGGRGNPAGQRHGPRSLSVSQPLPLLHVQGLFPGVRQVSHRQYLVLTASKRREAARKPVAASSFSSRVAVLNPSPTLPRRKLALPMGRRLHNGLRDVGVARPTSSRRQHTYRFARLLLRFDRVRHDLEAFLRFRVYASETPIS